MPVLCCVFRFCDFELGHQCSCPQLSHAIWHNGSQEEHADLHHPLTFLCCLLKLGYAFLPSLINETLSNHVWPHTWSNTDYGSRAHTTTRLVRKPAGTLPQQLSLFGVHPKSVRQSDNNQSEHTSLETDFLSSRTRWRKSIDADRDMRSCRRQQLFSGYSDNEGQSRRQRLT